MVLWKTSREKVNLHHYPLIALIQNICFQIYERFDIYLLKFIRRFFHKLFEENALRTWSYAKKEKKKKNKKNLAQDMLLEF